MPSPDTALLAAGWERNAETDEYRLPGTKWRSLADARADQRLRTVIAAEREFTIPPDEPETPMSPETSVILLLVDILKELRTIGRALGSPPPLLLRRADIEHREKMDAIARQAEAAAARKLAAAQKDAPHER